ncbi:MAG: hypothetical protein MI700_10910 [Balneolales bacterium]|nr:hypothetical protein [Balneolales bacterium]
MKTLIITLALLVFTGLSSTTAQNINPENNIEKVVTHVIGKYYDVAFYNTDGELLQSGQYYQVENKLKPHGIWKLYDTNTLALVTTAKYDKGEQLWVETTIDGKVVRLNQYEIQIHRLQNRIAELEEKVDGTEK